MRVVEMVPVRVVEMVPVRVVEMVPVRVVEIVPAAVVEMVPDLATAVVVNDAAKTAAHTDDLSVFMSSPGANRQGWVGSLDSAR